MPAAAPAHRLRTGEADPSSVANPDLFRVDRPAPVVEFRQDSPRDRAAVGERRAARPPSGALPDAAGGTTDETARLHRPGGLRRRGHAPLRRPIPRSTSPRRGVRGCRPSERATPGAPPWSARAGAVAAGRSGRSASAVATTVRWSGSSPARPASERQRGSGPGQGRGRTRAGGPAGDRGPLPRRWRPPTPVGLPQPDGYRSISPDHGSRAPRRRGGPESGNEPAGTGREPRMPASRAMAWTAAQVDARSRTRRERRSRPLGRPRER